MSELRSKPVDKIKLDTILKSNNLTVKEFCKSIGRTDGWYRSIVNRTGRISLNDLLFIEEKYNVDVALKEEERPHPDSVEPDGETNQWLCEIAAKLDAIDDGQNTLLDTFNDKFEQLNSTLTQLTEINRLLLEELKEQGKPYSPKEYNKRIAAI